MAGILNNKERIIDFIITKEGKRQATSGQLKVEYASFTDLHTFYELSGSAQTPELSSNAENRIFFEATDRYQDVIVPELEAGNSLRPFKTADFQFNGVTVSSGTFKVGFQDKHNIITGSAITNIAEKSLHGITQNFSDMRVLSTEDNFSDTSGFSLSRATGSFDIWNNMAMGRTATETHEVTLEESESLFADRRFSHFSNFSYLPPVNLPTIEFPDGQPMGNYPRLNEAEAITYRDLKEQLSDKQMVELEFSDTSRDNNLVGQVFEFSSAGIEKLSIIDFGEFEAENPYSTEKRVYFVGKMYRDSNGSETFMNIFTMVLE